jgi:hypothetical protein
MLLMSNGTPRPHWQTQRQWAAHSDNKNAMPIVKAGVLYFALVFGTGFLLGTVRTLWIVPLVGTRTELMETPIMLVSWGMP